MDTTTQIQDIAVTDDVAAKHPPFDFEKAVALLATGLVGLLLVLTASNAGPLWRDETNSINLVQMPSLNEFWKNLKFDSFPLTWLLVLRAWDVIGFAQTDFGIRLLGLMVGFGSLGALWLCARWFGTRGPIISLALLGTLPTFINIVGANRAYGLAVCLLLLSFASIWRVVQSPSKPRLLLAILVTLLFVHCVFYDLIFLAAMLFAGAVVVLRRKQWKALLALTAIGGIACASLVIYVPMIRQQSHPELVRVPFSFWTLWTKFSLAVESRSSARIPISIGSESWVWVILALLGVGSAMLIQRHWRSQGDDLGKMEQGNSDLSLFGAITLICGALGFTWFLLRIQLPTQSWYYVIALSLFTVCFEATLATHLKAFRPWGLMRVCFLIVAALWGGQAVFEEAHTRRSNVDLVAQRLRSECKDGDLILVQTPWEAITFDRYFQHTTKWMSVPPIAPHKLHRVDLLIEKLNDPKLLDPVMEAVDKALDGGHDVWVVGHVDMSRTPNPRKSTEPWLGAYFTSWGSEVMAHILGKSELIELSSSPKGLPLNYLENLPLKRFRAQPPTNGIAGRS